MTIDAAIVAGGRGARMAPATDHIPKPMLAIGGKPILEHQISWLKASGFSKIFLCLGYKADAVRSFFGDGHGWGMSLRYSIETSPRGTAGAVRDLLPMIKADDILVVYGDLYVSMDCRKLLDYHRSHAAAATLVVCETDHPFDSDLARLEGDRITGFFRAKPGEAYENLACAAVWIVRRRLLDLVPKDTQSDFGRDIFPRALASGEVLMAYRTSEQVVDLGTPERREAFLRGYKAS